LYTVPDVAYLAYWYLVVGELAESEHAGAKCQ